MAIGGTGGSSSGGGASTSNSANSSSSGANSGSAAQSGNSGGDGDSGALSSSAKASADYDPYLLAGISRNNLEVYKDSKLRDIEKKMRFKCAEILFKLSCTSHSIVYTRGWVRIRRRIEEVIVNQNGANPSTPAQMMDLKLKEEQEKEKETTGSTD